MFSRFIFPIILFSLFSFSFSETKKIQIHTSFYPLTYMAKRIVGGTADVVSLVPPNIHPTYWKPTRKDILKLHQSDLILLNGAGLEKWTTSVTLPSDKVLITTDKFNHEYINLKNAKSHSHGSGKTHTHKGTNRFTWLDPINFIQQAESIKNKLVEKYPAQKPVFEQGFMSLKKDLNEIDKDLRDITALNPQQPLITSHPVYPYLAKRYQWNVHDLHLEPKQMPSAKTLEEIKALGKKLNSQFLIWEVQPKKAIEDKILKETGLKSVVFNTCIKFPAGLDNKKYDYLTIMKQNVEVLRGVFHTP